MGRGNPSNGGDNFEMGGGGWCPFKDYTIMRGCSFYRNGGVWEKLLSSLNSLSASVALL